MTTDELQHEIGLLKVEVLRVEQVAAARLARLERELKPDKRITKLLDILESHERRIEGLEGEQNGPR
jgi:hypothetical protein